MAEEKRVWISEQFSDDELLPNVVTNELQDGIPVLMKTIKSLPSSPWNVSSVRTFTEIMEDAASGKVSQDLSEVMARMPHLQKAKRSMPDL